MYNDIKLIDYKFISKLFLLTVFSFETIINNINNHTRAGLLIVNLFYHKIKIIIINKSLNRCILFLVIFNIFF